MLELLYIFLTVMESVPSRVETSSKSSSHSSSTSTGDHSKILDRYSCKTGPVPYSVPYGFHPVCDRRDRSHSPTVSNSESDDSASGEFPFSPDYGSRVVNMIEWYSCGNCGPMLMNAESLWPSSLWPSSLPPPLYSHFHHPPSSLRIPCSYHFSYSFIAYPAKL